MRTLHVTILPDPFSSFEDHVKDGRGKSGTVCPDLLSKQHLHNTSLSCMHWTELKANTWGQSFLSKKQENKDFFSSPTLHLAAFHHSYGKGEENSHPTQATGKDTVTDRFPGTAGCAQSWFQFHQQASCEWRRSHCQAGEESRIPATGLFPQTLLFANMETNPRWHTLLLRPGSVSRISKVNVKLT